MPTTLKVKVKDHHTDKGVTVIKDIHSSSSSSSTVGQGDTDKGGMGDRIIRLLRGRERAFRAV